MSEVLGGLSGEHWAAIAAVVVALLGGYFAGRGRKADQQHDALKVAHSEKASLRDQYLDTAIEIMETVGVIITPPSEEDYEDAWHNFAHIFSGRAKLFVDSEVAKAMTAFGNEIWELDWDYIQSESADAEAAQEARETAADSLASALRESLDSEFKFMELNPQILKSAPNKRLKNKGTK